MAANENVGVARVCFAPPPNIKVVGRLAPPPPQLRIASDASVMYIILYVAIVSLDIKSPWPHSLYP